MTILYNFPILTIMMAAKKSGFSLIELSIVVIVIALIIAGITAGMSLTRDLKIRSVFTQITKYKTAINAFKIQYNGLPGDIKNASSYWPSCYTTPLNCNGNGNGKIDDNGTNFTSESIRSWQQLSNAGLIEGSYTGIASGTNRADPGINVPKTAIDSGMISLIYESNPIGGTSLNTNIFRFGTNLSNDWLGSILTTKEALNLDIKIDDGLANNGIMMSYNGRIDASGTSVLCKLGPSGYNLSLPGLACSPAFILK